jgi:site-specific recombinase XerD
MTASATPAPQKNGFPLPAAIAALRAWYQGLDARQAVVRYLGDKRATGQSSRAILSGIRKQLAEFARRRHQPSLESLFDHPASQRGKVAKQAMAAIESMRHLPVPTPSIVDNLAQWLPARAAAKLNAAGMVTLADVAPRTLQRRRWWVDVPGLGVASARQIESLLAEMPDLMSKATELVVASWPVAEVSPWERLVIPISLDGSDGELRAPAKGCTIKARTDLEAVNAWLARHETQTTTRAYRKEVERLIVWAILERRKPLSSLMQEDAVAYRAFLRSPAPRDRWIGPARPRSSPDWRPFQGPLSPRSIGYSMSVINGLFRWLVEQRYLLANPFAGIKVKGAAVAGDVDASKALTRHEWDLVRIEADKVQSQGWTEDSADRLRFILDFWLGTGLRPSEMVAATLGNIDRREGGDNWIHVRGKGDKPGKVGLPSLAISALERYLAQRRLPVSAHLWKPDTPLVPSLSDDAGGLTTARMWALLKRFFLQAADGLASVNPILSEKLRRMTPHWLRHTHATIALAAGVELRSVRDNLRHASISTTTGYLNPDDQARARQLRDAFPG